MSFVRPFDSIAAIIPMNVTSGPPASPPKYAPGDTGVDRGDRPLEQRSEWSEIDCGRRELDPGDKLLDLGALRRGEP